ncbi:ABC transporter permease [uncultured Prevotella sp.]|nr:ABC transporter permease [uncultured Prevotella sp.]
MADNFLERQRRDYEQRKQHLQQNNQKHATSVAEILRRARQRFNND